MKNETKEILEITVFILGDKKENKILNIILDKFNKKKIKESIKEKILEENSEFKPINFTCSYNKWDKNYKCIVVHHRIDFETLATIDRFTRSKHIGYRER